MRVAVIGGGPSGLVTLKYLLTSHLFLGTDPVEAMLFESEDSVGGVFAHRVYEDAELVSSKQLTTFSDFRPNPEDPDFLSAERYRAYLNDYCTHFKLWEHINLSTTVIKVRRGLESGHVVTFRRNGSSQPEDYHCDAVAICSGLHVEPNIPRIEGIERVPVVFHSSKFKKYEQLGVDKTILILGSGETAMDIGYMAMQVPAKRVLMSHRDGFFCAPKRVPDPVIFPILGNKPDPTRLNVPVDSSSASLFDTAYVHHRLRDHMLLWHYYDRFIKWTLWLVGGSKYGMGQFIGQLPDEKYHASKILFNKSSKAIPYLSAPYISQSYSSSSLLQRIRSSIIQVPLPTPPADKVIDLAPWPSRIDSSGAVHFTRTARPEYHRLKNQSVSPDVVIYATGYTHSFPFLSSSSSSGSAGQYPAGPEKVDTRSIFDSADPSVAFIGFVRPSFGAIPPLSELQAQLWVARLLAPHLLPGSKLDARDEGHYRLKRDGSARIQYGVDHESYAYQLALDMGAAVGFCEVVRMGWGYKGRVEGGLWKLVLVWALGANFNTKFRLRGPWVWDSDSDSNSDSDSGSDSKGGGGGGGGAAKEVMVGELWETVSRRGGFFGHVTLSGLPMMVFGLLSLVCWILEPIFKLVEQVGGGGVRLKKMS